MQNPLTPKESAVRSSVCFSPGSLRRLLGAAVIVGFALASPLGAQSSNSSDEVVTLNPLQVTGDADNGYKVSSASTATRMNTALIDIPQTVDIVTSQFWRDMGSSTYDQSFKYVGNAFERNRNGAGDNIINLRGFQTGASIAVDGVLVGNQYYNRDLVGYDRLEIVKGPPSAVQGRAGGSGLFNYILKKPELKGSFANLRYITGTDDFSDNYNRGEVDVNEVMPNNAVAGRVAVAWQRSDDYIKFQHFSIVAVYPSFRWKINDATEVTWTNEILKSLLPSREEGHGFAVYPYKARILLPRFNVASDPITGLRIPYNFNIAGPGENAYQKVASSTLFITHQFDSHLTYRQVANWRTNSNYNSTFTGEDNTNTLINSQYSGSNVQYHNVTIQGDLVGRYNLTPWLSSATLLGYNWRMAPIITSNYSGIPAAPFNKIDIVALALSGDNIHYFDGRTVSPTQSAYTSSKAYNTGVYIEEDFGIWHDRLLLNGSIRRDHDATETDSLLTNKQTAASNSWLTSYRYGATFKITRTLAAYAVESLQNDPATSYQRYNGLLAGDPRLLEFFTVSPSTKLYEFGLKGELLDGRLSFTANHWQMNRTGAVQNFLQSGVSNGQPVTYGTQVVLEGAESHGYEFSAYGSITNRLSLIANYTRMYTSQQNTATPDQPGNLLPLQFAPIWNYNAFLKYNIPLRPRQSLDVKFGVAGIGPFSGQFTIPPAQVLRVPHSQKNLDAGISYLYENYSVGVMVTNLDNDPFLLTRDQPPRTYRFTLEARF